MTAPRDHRHRIAASILVVLLLGAYFVASTGGRGALPVTFIVNAVILTLAFWFPAGWTARPADLLDRWKLLLVWTLAWTLAWDLAMAAVLAERSPFQEWWIVYPAGLLFLPLLLVLHGAIVARFGTVSAR